MKIAIIGAGAMGCLFGGKLAEKADVCLYDVNKEHVKAMNQNGLRMTMGEDEKYVKVKAVTDPGQIGIVDAAIFFTKYVFMKQAAADALCCIGPDTLVLTLQNGLGCQEILKEFINKDQIAYGLTAYTSDMKAVSYTHLPSIASLQETVTCNGEETEIEIKGRHDPIIVPRAVVVVEAMAALTVADLLLMSAVSRIDRLASILKE